MLKTIFSWSILFLVLQMSAQPIPTVTTDSNDNRYYLNKRYDFVSGKKFKYYLEVTKDSTGVIYRADGRKKGEGNLLFFERLNHPVLDGEWTFYDKKEQVEKHHVYKNELPKENMIISTLDKVDRPYEKIGLVTHVVDHLFYFERDLTYAKKKFYEKCIIYGGDAVIGFKYELVYDDSFGPGLIMYGTLVKFL